MIGRSDFTYQPKSSGSDVNDISFKPNTVKFLSCVKPIGKRGIGFELKSAVCKLRRCFISSGMFSISGMNKEIIIKIIIIKEKEEVCLTDFLYQSIFFFQIHFLITKKVIINDVHQDKF